MKKFKAFLRSVSPFTNSRNNKESKPVQEDDEFESYWWDLSGVNLQSALTKFYVKHNPEKVHKVELILEKFRGDEVELLRELCKRHNVKEKDIQKLLDASINVPKKQVVSAISSPDSKHEERRLETRPADSYSASRNATRKDYHSPASVLSINHPKPRIYQIPPVDPSLQTSTSVAPITLEQELCETGGSIHFPSESSGGPTSIAEVPNSNQQEYSENDGIESIFTQRDGGTTPVRPSDVTQTSNDLEPSIIRINALIRPGVPVDKVAVNINNDYDLANSNRDNKASSYQSEGEFLRQSKVRRSEIVVSKVSDERDMMLQRLHEAASLSRSTTVDGVKLAIAEYLDKYGNGARTGSNQRALDPIASNTNQMKSGDSGSNEGQQLSSQEGTIKDKRILRKEEAILQQELAARRSAQNAQRNSIPISENEKALLTSLNVMGLRPGPILSAETKVYSNGTVSSATSSSYASHSSCNPWQEQHSQQLQHHEVGSLTDGNSARATSRNSNRSQSPQYMRETTSYSSFRESADSSHPSQWQAGLRPADARPSSPSKLQASPPRSSSADGSMERHTRWGPEKDLVLDTQYDLAKKYYLHSLSQNKISQRLAVNNLLLQERQTQHSIDAAVVAEAAVYRSEGQLVDVSSNATPRSISINNENAKIESIKFLDVQRLDSPYQRRINEMQDREQAQADDWIECFDPKNRKHYYYSAKLKKSTWRKPARYVPMNKPAPISRQNSPSGSQRSSSTMSVRSATPDRLSDDNSKRMAQSSDQISIRSSTSRGSHSAFLSSASLVPNTTVRSSSRGADRGRSPVPVAQHVSLQARNVNNASSPMYSQRSNCSVRTGTVNSFPYSSNSPRRSSVMDRDDVSDLNSVASSSSVTSFSRARSASSSRKWASAVDPISQRVYWYNRETRESVWKKPREAE